MRLRRHQREALAALDDVWASGRRRAWVALPPGAGKTLVGLETVSALVASGAVGRAVVLGPNTAIQAQWAAAGAGLGVSTTRELDATLTALTYQAVAVFDADAEVSDEGGLETAAARPPRPPGDPGGRGGPPGPSRDQPSLLDQLHENGRAFVETLRAAGPLLLVLDECHHLLEVWGRLLAELLEVLPEAYVLGLTATPPEALTGDQAALVEELFGAPVYRVSIPAVVREGDLAPYLELAWLTTPTAAEDEWLAEDATRFAELVTQLCDPAFGSVPFLQWLDARFVSPRTPWAALVREEPDLCRAVLRLHHAGLLGLPAGARVQEEHRTPPTADDWVELVDDWLTRSVATSEAPEDAAVVEAVRLALPSVGYQWTRRGIRRGRSPVDRVLARSEAKTRAVVELCGHERRALGERLRMLVLCDHERAGATLPAALTGVIDQQAGSAVSVLQALVESPDTADLRPLLVTGRAVTATPETLTELRAWLPDRELAATLEVVPTGDGLAELVGPWSSRRWVAPVTAWFQAGRSQVLVGTRALLGEGWDADKITGLADLTAVTTTTSVVQTRGRALRVDPQWPEKVAVSWSLVCVSDRHPKGGNDWNRLVRKHAGYFGLDDDGEVVDGVAHLDAAFSPYAAPPVAEFDAANARAVVRAEGRDRAREQWRVGTPYADSAVPVVRIKERRAGSFGAGTGPAPLVLRPDAAADARVPVRSADRWRAATGLGAALLVAAALLGSPLLAVAGAVLALLASGAWLAARVRAGEALLAEAGEAPSVARIAAAVADGLHATGLTSRGADAVGVVVDREGEYRCVLHDVPPEEAGVFATALDEAVAPIGLPRYLLPRYVLAAAPPDWRRALRTTAARLRPDGVVWHAVPTVLGVNAERAAAYARAWDRWVGGGAPVWTGSPEGAGVLAAQQGSDPFAASTVMRRSWE